MKRESLTMATVGFISVFYGTTHYLETQRFDVMSLVMGTLSVLYFVSLGFKQEQEDDSNR
jgi:hypothetical protein